MVVGFVTVSSWLCLHHAHCRVPAECLILYLTLLGNARGHKAIFKSPSSWGAQTCTKKPASRPPSLPFPVVSWSQSWYTVGALPLLGE